jgi:polyketide synthase PksJ
MAISYKRKLTGLEVAVIGIGCRFPGAKNIGEFWDNLANGVESICFLKREEMAAAGVSSDLLDHPDFVKTCGGVLEDKEYFDASFFGYTPREAEIMDPQIRVFHECVWEALEDAGYTTDLFHGSIGIYTGASFNFHWNAISTLTGKANELGQFEAGQLTNKDFIATRIAYELNLTGPAVTVQTACSTSLVSIHLACRALLMGECDISLAGGVTIWSQKSGGYLYNEGMIHSPDGHCRAFDAGAKGIVGGEGAGVVVLKKFKNAVSDRDNIRAVVLGSAINNDGRRKVGYSAPSLDAQVNLIRSLHFITEVEPESITYIEAHGTGTPLGDPIEIEALKQAFKTGKEGFCTIGSVKTNIGHLDSGAGVAGFIKTVLALEHKLIPPSLHFSTPNPNIDFENSPFKVNTALSEWTNEKFPLRAGISSFGMGGTNAHVLLEEAPPTGRNEGLTSPRADQLLLLSARTRSALKQMAANLADLLRKNTGINLADAAYTLKVGRKALAYRGMLLCPETDEAVEALSTVDEVSPGNGKRFHISQSKADQPPVIFMFPGLGSQYVNMGLDLYRQETVFRQEMDRCFNVAGELLGYGLKDILYPSEGSLAKAKEAIDSIEISQLAIFMIEYALARLIMAWGVKPQAMIGYSFGEYTAALISGIFSLEDGLTIISERTKLLGKVPDGAMLSIPLPKEEIKPFMNTKLSLAIDNGPSCIVAGARADIETFEMQMKRDGYICMPVQSSFAIHSAMMEPLMADFTDRLASLHLNAPNIPYISNVSGTWMTDEQALDPGYWAQHLRHTVQFSSGIKELVQETDVVFLEIGPGRDLSSLLMRYIENSPGQHVLDLIRHPDRNFNDTYYLLKRIGQLWLHGVNIDWTAFYVHQKRRRVPLPTYPFERQRYWIDGSPGQISVARSPKIGKKADIADWFYLPQWKRSMMPLSVCEEEVESVGDHKWLVFSDHDGLGAVTVDMLKQKSAEAVTVRIGDIFKQVADNEFLLNPRQPGDYNRLFEVLDKSNQLPDRIVHFWSLTREVPEYFNDREYEDIQYRGFFSLLFMAKAIGKQGIIDSLQLLVVANQLQEISGEETLYPEKATLLGPVKVIQQEFPFINCRCLDIVISEPGTPQREEWLKQVLMEFEYPTPEPIIAYRDSYRWIQVFEPIRIDEIRTSIPRRLREEGVYLITGGLGQIGLILARYLAESARARLVLVGRSPFPSPEKWKGESDRLDESDPTFQRIKQLQEIESLGGKVTVYSADVGDEERMRDVIKQAENSFGPINGIIHAAGIIGDKTIRLINDIEEEGCREMFAAKIEGLAVLEKIFRDKEPDFFLLTSSLSPILGGLGFSAYSAANQFMDTFVYRQNRKNRGRWLSVNWADWRFERGDVGSRLDNQKEHIALSMNPDEGIETFKRILHCGPINQLVVSAGDLGDRLSRWVLLDSLRQEERHDSKEESAAPAHRRPDLMNPYAAPRNFVEERLVEIWQNLFGFAMVGIQDDFFELGGDSLKAITVISKIHKGLNVAVPLTEFFNGATIEKLAEYVNNSQKSGFRSIDPVEKKEFYPLSSIQKRLYYTQLVEQSNVLFNMSYMFFLGGELDIERLEYTFKKLVQRHESFRTSLEIVKGEVVQRIYDTVDFHIEHFDLFRNFEISPSEYPDILKTHLNKIIDKFVRPFDLSEPCFLRIGLAEIEKNRYFLLVDMHHVISDGISIATFIREFMSIYRDKKLTDLKIQYKDYSEWQNSEAQIESLAKKEQFWMNVFKGTLPILNLPYDYARPTILNFEGSNFYFEINKDETYKLKKYVDEFDVTTFILLLAIFYVFLFKLSGQDDIVVGTPIVNRTHEDVNHIIGPFANVLALRNYPQGHKPFRDFLIELKRNVLEAFENQDYQFGDLVEKIGEKRDLSRNPLFDVQIQYENIEMPKIEIPGLKLIPYHTEDKLSKLDLMLHVMEEKEILKLAFYYRIKLFNSTTIEKFAAYYRQLVSSVITDPDKNLKELKFTDKKSEEKIMNDLFDELENE